ncbi:MAG TPA: peptidoglycan-binding domain-containing protein [Bryobacteraceae bacterium]|nr:peptidoglycan-binding domain-containing protein [Bryobacteraceae bacterium]
MKRSIFLGVALCAGAWLASAATTASTKKKTTKKRTHAVSAPIKSHTTAGKTSRGKKTATRTPARSRQLAPTKERYQQIQQALASKGYFSGEPNGTWGADSTEALKRFQADQSLTPDGKLGSLSLIALGLGPKRLSAQSAAKPAPAPQQQ